MKNAALVVAIALASPLPAQSVEFGPRVGLAFSTVSVKSPTGQDNTQVNGITGLAAGGYVRLSPGRPGVQVEINFIRKGASVVPPSNPSDALDIQLDYIEIPVLLVLPVGGASAASASLYGGPALALEASCHGTLTGLPSRDHFDCDNPNFDVFDRRKVDVGVTLGGGMRIAMGRGALVADLRYTLGFTNLNKETGDQVRNRSAMVALGYSLVR